MKDHDRQLIMGWLLMVVYQTGNHPHGFVDFMVFIAAGCYFAAAMWNYFHE